MCFLYIIKQEISQINLLLKLCCFFQNNLIFYVYSELMWPLTRCPSSLNTVCSECVVGDSRLTAHGDWWEIVPSVWNDTNSKSKLIWLHRDTDYSQGDYTGHWDATRPLCLCVFVCVSACLPASATAGTRHSSPSINPEEHKIYNSVLRSDLILRAVHSVRKWRC